MTKTNDEKEYMIKDDIDQEEEDHDKIEYPVPEQLNTCQWVCVIFLYLILAFLIGFIIYFSATWDKPRPNEYA